MIAHSVLPASGAGAVRIFPCPGALRANEQDGAPKGGA